MKRRKKKMSRIVSLLLAAAMIVTSLPQSMFTVNAAEVSGAAVADETLSEAGTQGNDASENVKPEGETSGNDSSKDGIADGDSSGDNASDEGKADDEASDEGKSDEDSQEKDKNEGETSEDGDTSGEDDEKEDAGQVDDGESQDGEEEGEEAGSVDSDNADKLDSEESLLGDDGEEKEPIRISIYGDSEYYTLYNADGNYNTDQHGFFVPYGSKETLSFKIVPKTGCFVTIKKNDLSYAGMKLSITEVNGEYECTISPIDEEIGYVHSAEVNIDATKKARYRLTFVYSSADVDELVLTNNPNESASQVNNNVPVLVANNYNTSFKLKARAGKSLAVSYVSEDGENYDGFIKYYEYAGNGYYNFDLGQVCENATITIKDGWKINFEYNDDEIEELYREILIGNEEDLVYDNSDVAYFTWSNTIEHTEVVPKGEPFYFNFYSDENNMSNWSVTDRVSGNTIDLVGPEYIYAENKAYKVIPTSDMTIEIKIVPLTLPVTFVEGVVSDISIIAQDEDGEPYEAYDNGKIINIRNEMTEYKISFKIAADKHFDRVELVCCEEMYDFDTGEMNYDYYYPKLDVEEQPDGTYASVESFYIDSWTRGLRIIADDTYTVTFNPSDEVKLYASDDSMMANELSGKMAIVKDSEYRFIITLDKEYELATPCVIAEYNGESHVLEVGERYPMKARPPKGEENGDKWEEGNEKEVYAYDCSITPTAETKISVSLNHKSVPFICDKNAIESIEIGNSSAKLSDDWESIYIQTYGELPGCEIKFALKADKAVIGAYYGYTGEGWNEKYEWTTSTYSKFIPAILDEMTQLYTVTLDIPDFNEYRIKSIDYIQIVAGDKCEISFEGYEGKAEIFDFNSYNYDVDSLENAQHVEAVKNGEYLFRVELSWEYDAASLHVTTEDGKELPVKYYSRQEPYSENRPIQYYSFTPTEDASTVSINLSPLTIPVNYTDSAVRSLELKQYDGVTPAYAPTLSADSKTVSVWNCDLYLNFDLELESGSTLSRIFCRRANVDDRGNIIDGYYEDDIWLGDTVDGKYHFEVDVRGHNKEGSDLLGIEIVTDKVNLDECNVELKLPQDEETGKYYASYIAEEIEPEVTVTYEDNGDTTTLAESEYTVTYKNNRNVGKDGAENAYVIITANEDSTCTGGKSVEFIIKKAQAPEIAPISISVDTNDTRENRELNLSNRIVVNTDRENGIKPVAYNVNTQDTAYTKGGVLADDPVIGEPQKQEYWDGESQEYKEILTYILNYSIKEDANADSAKAVIVLTASFDNYDDARVVIEVSMAKKETVILDGYALTRTKKYDAKPYSYDYDNLYIVEENGSKSDDSDDIMKALEDYIKFHYKGNEIISGYNKPYDSYEAPVNAGYYTLTVEISEENEEYTAAPYEVGEFRIDWRSITIRPLPVTISVNGELPEKYDYKLTGDGLLDGDVMIPEPTVSCEADNTETAGRYQITVDMDEMDIFNSNGDSVGHNYSISAYHDWLTIIEEAITEITLSEKQGAQTTKVYDGTAFDGISLIDIKDGETPVTDAKITVKYAGREGTNTVYAETTKAPVNVGEYTMKAKVASNDGKYKSNEVEVDITITKAEAPNLQEQVISLQPVTEDTPKTLDLTRYIPSGYEVTGYGTVGKTDSDNVLTGTEQVDAQGVLSYTLKENVSTGTAVLTIPIEFKNHKEATLTVNINLTDKTLLTLTQTAGVDVNKEYDGDAYVLPEGAVTVSGMEQGADKPKLNYAYTLRDGTAAGGLINAGAYTVTVTVSGDDANYIAQEPLVINFEITRKTVNVKAEDGEWDKTLTGEHPTATDYLHGYEAKGLIGSDKLTGVSVSYTYTYVSSEGKTVTLKDADDDWNALEADTRITVTPSGPRESGNYNINYVSGTLTVTDNAAGAEFVVENIKPMVYTGSPLKPAVVVKVRTNNALTELSAKDYKVTYSNNINAGTATVTITGKGNYDKTITKNFTIEPASIGEGSENKELGITLKYTDQSLDTKASKLVTSLKYKKALKEGTDFTVTLTKAGAGGDAVSRTEGTTPAKTPTGADKAGAYKLLIEAKDNTNYSGYIEKTVYVAGKNNLLKNAKITLKKKSLKWDDRDTANYGNYSKENWGGFYLEAGSSKNDKDFTVSIGKDYLANAQSGVNDKDADKSKYFISYTNNDQAGTATITVTGNGTDYFGTKSATFKIQGTAFKAGTKPGNITLPDTLTAPEDYTGEAITKELDSLEIVGKTEGTGSSAVPAKLTKDEDYTVTHSNNVKRGSATVIITANPKSGYTGSIKKSFKIQAADLKTAIYSGRDGIDSRNVDISFGTGENANRIAGVVYKGAAPYSKAGATIPGLIFTNREGEDLKAGVDYTVKYSYTTKNAGSGAVMTLKGKGNYSGTLNVNFTITKADYESLDVSVASVKLGKKAVEPKVTVKDGKKALTVSKDGNKEVMVKYENNEPAKVEAWLNDGAPENKADIPAPTVTVTIKDTENYSQTQPDVITLNIYKDKLDKKKLTINWSSGSDSPNAVYMNGSQVKPVIASIKYDNTTYDVIKINGEYFACDNSEARAKVFRITYGANNKSGKNAGSVTIEGMRLYGGKYTQKFEISRKDISSQ